MSIPCSNSQSEIYNYTVSHFERNTGGVREEQASLTEGSSGRRGQSGRTEPNGTKQEELGASEYVGRDRAKKVVEEQAEEEI